MKLKKVLAVLLAAVMAGGLLAGCSGGSGNSSKSAVDKIKDKGKLVMYTNAAFPPFEYAEGSKVAGVDVDIAQAVADELGVKLEVKDVKFATIVGAIKSGKADIGAAGMTITKERKKSVDFSDPYAKSVQYMIVANDSSFETLDDLAGKTIGVQEGTTGDLICSDETGEIKGDDGKKERDGILPGAEVKRYANAIVAAQDLKNGRLDAVVIDKLPAESITEKNSEFKTFEVVYADGSKTAEEYGIAVAKGNDDLVKVINDVIQKLNEEGKIDEFIIKHSTAAE